MNMIILYLKCNSKSVKTLYSIGQKIKNQKCGFEDLWMLLYSNFQKKISVYFAYDMKI